MEWFSPNDKKTAQVHVHHGGAIASGDFGYAFRSPEGEWISGTVQFPTGRSADQPTQEWNVEARGDVASFDVIMERVVTASVADIHVELPVPQEGETLTDGWGASFAGGQVTVARPS